MSSRILHSTSAVEPLERRIAPAHLFFLSASGLTVVGSSGATVDAAQEASDFGATVAVFLGAGDSLVLDVNGNHTLEKSDPVLVTVKVGEACVFVTDGAQGPAEGSFNANDITGMVAANKSVIDVNTGVVGAVVTGSFTAPDAFTYTKGQGGSLSLPLSGAIAGLNAAGAVGALLAGGNIANVTGTQIGAVAAGSSAAESFSLGGTMSGGPVQVQGAVSLTPGEAGASISGLHLSIGAESILAGDGQSSATGNAGAGGGISNVTMLDAGAEGTFELSPGHGGDATGAKGNAGAGGSFKSITIDQAAGVDLVAGQGGSITGADIAQGTPFTIGGVSYYGKATGSAGAGGLISKVTVSIDASTVTSGAVGIQAGNGGDMGTGGSTDDPFDSSGAAPLYGSGHGGAGGAVSAIKITVAGSFLSTGTLLPGESAIAVNGGGGGMTDESGAAGSGGSITGITVATGPGPGQTASMLDGGIQLAAGNGGVSTFGAGSAHAGSVSTIHWTIDSTIPSEDSSGDAIESMAISAGLGATGNAGAASSGGSVSGVYISAGASANFVNVIAGNGGSSLVGGAGGGVNGVHITPLTGGSTVPVLAEVVAGDAGISFGLVAPGVAGGSISNITTPGDIGYADRAFDSGLGGLFAGLENPGYNAAGREVNAANGHISSVSADHIAAIVAGQVAGDQLEFANAVHSISGVVAATIGTDVNENGVFDFTNVGAAGSPFLLGSGDAPIDGLVIVSASGFNAHSIKGAVLAGALFKV